MTDAAPRNTEVPRTFRRESRLFLWVALLLIFFLNLLTLVFLRAAVEWGTAEAERRSDEILRRVALSSGRAEAGEETMERAGLEPDVAYVALYDANGRRLRSLGQGPAEAPVLLGEDRPAPGRLTHAWRPEPPLLVSTFATDKRFFVLALEPGAGGALRQYARRLTWFIPLASVALAVLAGLYLRSLLQPYERLLAAAGDAPAAGRVTGDEREFVVARFEATIAALHEKERELERLARREKERADDLETAARTLSKNLPTGLLSVDPAGRVLELNEAGREILKLEREVRGEAYGRALEEAPDFRGLVEQVLLRRAVAGRREVRWRRRTGEERVLGVTATPAEGADGRFLGAVALFSDLTEIRELEGRVALARHLADLGQVSAGAAHEFRNAAAAIDGFADLALRSTDPERSAEYVRAIRQEAQEMSRVTSDFLLFARPEGFSPEPTDLAEVARAAAAEAERAFPGLAVARSGEFGEAAGSAVLLRRALVNLLRNAVEATPEARRSEPDAIVLAGGHAAHEATLSVGDRGPGVDAAAREQIFLPFYSSKPGGSGFGLAIVARIAALHGGTVDVGDRPGGGAVFTLRLPN
ncbi:MAG TPA: ATP-binding protein [Thermoanaerobaculia bacterium]|nr:ATP-binding protein [Thermoanaerobaculia bacterium]